MLHRLVLKQDPEMVEYLLAKGADINAKGRKNNTPLHASAYVGNKEISALLLAKGVDVNAINDEGHTPLFAAEKYEHKEAAELIKKAMAKH